MAAKRLHGQETEDRLAFICSTHVHPVASASIDVDDICSGRFDAAADKVSVLARALALEQSPQCRAEILAALARCAPLGCPVTIASAIKHCQDNDLNVQLAAVEVLTHTARKGDKNAVVTLVGLITGSIFKDPTQPGAFLNARDPGKNSLANMPRRPGDHSFRQSVKLRVAAVRALAAMCTESDLRVAVCLRHVAEEDVDKSVRAAAINALVSLGKSDLARSAEAAAKQRRQYQEMNVKFRKGAIHEAGQSMCEVFGLTAAQREKARGPRSFRRFIL